MIATSTQEALAEWEWESIEEEEQTQLQDGSIDYALIQVFVCPRSRTVAERENNLECSLNSGTFQDSSAVGYFRYHALSLISEINCDVRASFPLCLD